MKGEQEDRKMCMDGFSDWFEKELEDLHRRASLPAPIFFPKYLVWNWEFNEECDRYFPTYLEMLHEVDTMNDCLAHKIDNLLERLKPEFKARYAINSLQHPYLRSMSRMLQRKELGVWKCYQRRSDEIYKFLVQLIELKPYIKRTDCWDDVMDRLGKNCNVENLWPSEAPRTIDEVLVSSVLHLTKG
uniref:Uncharacterized protein n=1 Tax=Triticum urartu TaxID=4572 RepID=A0A8R7TZL4_TRIUA